MKGLLVNAKEIYRCEGGASQGVMSPIQAGAIAWENGVIKWCGQERDLPTEFTSYPRCDAEGGIVIPGLIDCHTHLAFGGWRDDEFEERIRGKTYSALLQEGRGILATVEATRRMTESELTDRARAFMQEMRSVGVTTIEAKSGYGLTVHDEVKQLRVYRTLDAEGEVTIVPTFLGAHAIPSEFRASREGYVGLVVNEMIPAVQSEGLARWIDVFVDADAFSQEEAARIIAAGGRAGMRSRLHVDQLRDEGGAAFAARMGAGSADHLDCVSQGGIDALARSEVVAVLLPLATLMVRTPVLDARRLLSAGVAVAIATDFNPGSAPSTHLPLAMFLGCVMHRLTPLEVLDGVTRVAAQSLGLGERKGTIAPGFDADLAVIHADSVRQWLYNFRENRCRFTVKAGVKGVTRS